MKIFLSGAEPTLHSLNAAVACELPNVLTSYHYAQQALKDSRRCALWTRLMVTAKSRMIDSGAFSFLYGATNAKEKPMPDFDQYLAGYMVWLRSQLRVGLADFWVELDLSQIVGYSWVHAQRDKMIANGLGAGLIAVWHSDADWGYWLDLLREAKRPGRWNKPTTSG